MSEQRIRQSKKEKERQAAAFVRLVSIGSTNPYSRRAKPGEEERIVCLKNLSLLVKGKERGESKYCRIAGYANVPFPFLSPSSPRNNTREEKGKGGMKVDDDDELTVREQRD
jgi:hypothetical protein